MRFFGLVSILFLASFNGALAKDYVGVLIDSNGSGLRLKDEITGKAFELTYANSNVQTVLQKLKVNDYVSFQGARSATVNSIRVDSVNFVGLSNLLHVWMGNDRYCYSFLNFTEFAIYPSHNSGCHKRPKVSKKYAYTINPTEFNDWVILLSSDQANYAADLKIKSANAVEISLYDSNTGYILKAIQLRK